MNTSPITAPKNGGVDLWGFSAPTMPLNFGVFQDMAKTLVHMEKIIPFAIGDSVGYALDNYLLYESKIVHKDDESFLSLADNEKRGYVAIDLADLADIYKKAPNTLNYYRYMALDIYPRQIRYQFDFEYMQFNYFQVAMAIKDENSRLAFLHQIESMNKESDSLMTHKECLGLLRSTLSLNPPQSKKVSVPIALVAPVHEFGLYIFPHDDWQNKMIEDVQAQIGELFASDEDLYFEVKVYRKEKCNDES